MKKLLSVFILTVAVVFCFAACGRKDNSAANNENARVSESYNTVTDNKNQNFDDLDKNDDGILDDNELKNDIDNIGDDIVTMIGEAGSMAEDIISDIIPDNHVSSETTK